MCTTLVSGPTSDPNSSETASDEQNLKYEKYLKKRIEHIDIAKGISITLVALHHSQLGILFTHVSHAMGLFRLPLFFFLSGVFFSPAAAPWPFIGKKTDALLKPYFVTLFALLGLAIVTENGPIMKPLLGIFYGNGITIQWLPLWFLTHLWFIFMLAYVLVRTTKLDRRSGRIKTLAVLALVTVGTLTLKLFWKVPITIFGIHTKLPGLPFSADVALLSLAFFISGFFLNQQVKSFTPKVNILVPAFFLFVIIAAFTGASVDLNLRQYDKPLLATAAAVSGIYMILSLSVYIGKGKILATILKTFGASSLFILIFHNYIDFNMNAILSKFLSEHFALFIKIVSFLASVTIPLLIRDIISRSDILKLFYFPFKSNDLLKRLRMRPSQAMAPSGENSQNG